jgi:prolipoprotein diacylglyceryl transferase
VSVLASVGVGLAPHLAALSIPSPANGTWHLGPLPLRGYALCIIAGIIAAIWISERRWGARGGRVGDIQDLAIWAVPFGLVGGRLYHVATDHDLYFGPGRHPVEALYIWNGGLGVWGSVFLGAVGTVIAARRKGIRLAAVLDVMAPTVLVAQAIGRWGNWFNQELYGRPTTLPWGLEIDSDHYPAGRTFPAGTTFHPTYLYEFVWNLLGFALLLYLERRLRGTRFALGHGRMVALYVMVYTLGRGWIESLRIDTVELNDVFGLRFNVWTSIVLFVVAAAYLVISQRLHPGQDESVYLPGREPASVPDGDVERAGRGTHDSTDDPTDGSAGGAAGDGPTTDHGSSELRGG